MKQPATKPVACPFDGGNTKVTGKRRGNYRREGTNYQVLCNSCGARGPLIQDDADRAVALWNGAIRRNGPVTIQGYPVQMPLPIDSEGGHCD